MGHELDGFQPYADFGDLGSFAVNLESALGGRLRGWECDVGHQWVGVVDLAERIPLQTANPTRGSVVGSCLAAIGLEAANGGVCFPEFGVSHIRHNTRIILGVKPYGIQ